MSKEDQILSLLENIQKQISLLEENNDAKFQAIDERFNDMDQRFNTIDERFNAIDQRFNAIDEKFNAVDQRFNAIDEKFNTVDQRFNAMEELITSEIESTRAELKVEIQYVHDELKDLRADLANVEQVTAKNWLDISRLKAIR